MNPTESTKKKDTVRISKKDLLKLLSDNEQQAKQIKDLQDRCNKYLEEVRDLKQKIEDVKKETLQTKIKEAMESVKNERPRNPMPLHPMGPDIYIDGASKFGR